MKKINFVVIISFFILSNNAFGQESVRTTISIGTNLSLSTINDKGMSSIQYDGFIPSIHSRLERRKVNSISTFFISGEKGILTPKGNKNGKIGTANQNGFTANYSYLRKINLTQKRWAIYTGLQLGTLLRSRLHNNLVNSARIYENINHIGPAIYVERKINLFQMPLDISVRMNVPVFAAVIRPSVTNLGDFLGRRDEELKDRFQEHGFTSFGNLLMIQNEVSLKYQLNKSDALAINYSWQYLDYSKVNSLQYASQVVGVSYVKGLWYQKNE